jgi:hypothetical protein
MISPAEIKTKAERRYIPYLKLLIEGVIFEKILIPGDKNYSRSTQEFQKEIMALVNHSKEKKGYGFSIDYQTIKTKSIGTQDLPVCIYFDSEKDFLRYLGKEKEVELFKNDWQSIVAQFPELKMWSIKNPQKIIQHHKKWEDILKVCHYFRKNPQPNLYIRELPIKVHTKFVEENESIIRELLDIIITPYIDEKEKEFEKHFHLKYKEPLVRFRILDTKISQAFFSGLDDISIPVNQFEKLELPLRRVIIVENKTTLYTTLTLPNMNDSIAIFGAGYSVCNLKNADWINRMELLYWGDIDTHGFEILSQVRGYFPHTKSILMDKTTFDKYFENDLGTPSVIFADLHLNEQEKELYHLLKLNNWRLEQEKIPVEYVNEHLIF